MINDTSTIDSTNSSTSTERERYTTKIIVLTTQSLTNKERD